jgi:hypothetical protein
MSTIHQETEAVATRAWTEGRMVYFELTDQRIVGFPANRFRRLRDASESELADVRLEVGGTALRWDSVDEDISIEGVIAGRRDGHGQKPEHRSADGSGVEFDDARHGYRRYGPAYGPA